MLDRRDAWPLAVERAVNRRSDRDEAIAAFAFKNDEQGFARGLLSASSRLWLFRCNQRAFCGDFIAIDLSSARPDRRRVWVLELKRGQPLRVGSGGVQMKNADKAVAEIATLAGVICANAAYDELTGDGGLVIDRLAPRVTRPSLIAPGPR